MVVDLIQCAGERLAGVLVGGHLGRSLFLLRQRAQQTVDELIHHRHDGGADGVVDQRLVQGGNKGQVLERTFDEPQVRHVTGGSAPLGGHEDVPLSQHDGGLAAALHVGRVEGVVHGAGTGIAVGGDDAVHAVQPGFESRLELRVVLDLAGVLGVLQVGEAGLGVLFQYLLLHLPQDVGRVALEVGNIPMVRPFSVSSRGFRAQTCVELTSAQGLKTV